MKRSTLAALLCLTIAAPSCRFAGRGLVHAGAGIGNAGMAPGDWVETKPRAVRAVAWPVTTAAAVVGAVVGLPLMWVGAAFGGMD